MSKEIFMSIFKKKKTAKKWYKIKLKFYSACAFKTEKVTWYSQRIISLLFICIKSVYNPFYVYLFSKGYPQRMRLIDSCTELLTTNLSPNPPPPSCNIVFTSPKSKPNNFSDSTSLPRQRKIETVIRLTRKNQIHLCNP